MPVTPGELPPPAPKVFFGRGELVEKIVDLSQRFTSMALTGTGGIGKTSVVLTVLNDRRIKHRFGDSRSFIRCDRLIPSHTHFLRKLSEAIGAGAENPEDLSPLRQYLSSKEMMIVLDNAESILGLPEANAGEIYTIVDELSQFSNICLVITSRISNTLPPHCEIIEIPTLSMEAGHETFYRIYRLSEQSDEISKVLKELDFHPLCITLLATVAQQNRWNTRRLTTEWEKQRTGVLRARNVGSLAATVELSLASPIFQELGADAREVLGVVAFLPQGVNEDNVDKVFPTISDGPSTFDTFCALSLTYRNGGFITMLAPLRGHLRPKDPRSSALLRTTKEIYFNRLSGEVHPGKPGFEEARWITIEDINVEYLLDIFTTIDANSQSVWDTCSKFMAQLYWQKSRPIILGPKIEALPDGHPSKAQCLFDLARLFNSVGNLVEFKRLLTHSLKLWREQGNDIRVAETLRILCGVNRRMGLGEEGIPLAREACEIFKRLGEVVDQANSLINLALALCEAKQLDAAEEAGLRGLDLFPEKGEELWVCQAHRFVGDIYRSKGEMEKAIHHFEVALGIASSFNNVFQLFWAYYSLAGLYCEQGKFEEAQTHLEHAKSHAADDALFLALVTNEQARVFCRQHRFGEARSEALRALDAYEKLRATADAEVARQNLEWIDAEEARQPD